MIVDSSALMAVIEGEPEAVKLLRAMTESSCRMSLGSWVECSIVAEARSSAHGERFDRIVADLAIERVPVTERQADVARQAYRRYGKGSGSSATLNLGDCFAYALSVTEGEPLLCVGRDFAATDVARVALD